MLSEKFITIIDEVTTTTGKMIASFVDKEDLTGKVDFASIYARSSEEFNLLTKELQRNGSIAKVLPTGSYYWLKVPLQTKLGIVRRCRVRAFDEQHLERGYNDFDVVAYAAFKDKYLRKPNFMLLNKPKVEMIELRVPTYNIRAYFPNVRF
jgi:hypothetical protein